MGFKKVVLNAINFLAQLLLGFVESVLGIVDSIAGIFGADLGAADAIKSLRADIERGLTGGVEDVTAGIEITPAAGRASQLPNGLALSASPGVTASGAELAALESLNFSSAKPAEAPPITTHVSVNVDGEVLARATARAERSNAVRSFSPLPQPG